MTRLVAYIRVSKVAGREGDRFQSPDQQREAIGHAAALANGRIVEEIVELDESGGTMNRPGLQCALAMLSSDQADGIVVARLDRFGRNIEVPLVIRDLVGNGKVFLSAADQFDTSTPMGRFALGMMALVATLERDRHVETWGNSTRNAILRGVPMKVPYGYTRARDGRLEPAEPAASIVRRIFALRASGHGVAAIAHALNSEHAAPPLAASWTRQTVRAMLRTRTYLGEVHYGEHATVDAHPALIDAATWEAAQTPAGPSHAHGKSLLAGIVRCAGCGYLMGTSTGRAGKRYNCNRVHGTGHCPSPTSATAQVIEGYVTSLFLHRYGDVTVQSAETSPELLLLERALDAARREFQAWRDDTELRHVVGDSHYRAGLVARHRAVEEAERGHATAVREAGAATLAIDAAVWDDLTLPERRTLLAAGIDDVLLSRAAGTRTPIGERCVIRWTGEAPADGLPRQGVHVIR